MKTTLDVAAVLSTCIWPIVVLVILFVYRKPLGLFLSGLSGRLTKLSAFNISLELATLPRPPALWTNTSIHESSEMAGGDVSDTTGKSLFDRISADTPWEYLIVDVKGGRFWYVSRVFIFTLFLQAMRGLKCVVFVQSSDERRYRLIGLASPNSVHEALVQAFPWLEKAYENALRKHMQYSLGPALPPPTAARIIQTFIEDREMRVYCEPAEMIKLTNSCQTPEDQRPTDPINPEEWVRRKDMQTWEHTYWLDLSIPRVSEAVTKSFFEKDASRYVESPDVSTEDRNRALLRRKSPYIALMNSQGEFKALIDRQKLVALVAETLIEQ
jgi:hypothetical protein